MTIHIVRVFSNPITAKFRSVIKGSRLSTYYYYCCCCTYDVAGNYQKISCRTRVLTINKPARKSQRPVLLFIFVTVFTIINYTYINHAYASDCADSGCRKSNRTFVLRYRTFRPLICCLINKIKIKLPADVGLVI